MSGDDARVFIADDDLSMREALTSLLGTVGLRAAAFKTPQEFLKDKRPDDIPMTVQALKAGAVDFLTKPFRDQQAA
jgi:FixJ family two-component response regulator